MAAQLARVVSADTPAGVRMTVLWVNNAVTACARYLASPASSALVVKSVAMVFAPLVAGITKTARPPRFASVLNVSTHVNKKEPVGQMPCVRYLERMSNARALKDLLVSPPLSRAV